MHGDLASPAGVGGVLNKMPDPARVPDQVSYFYIKNVKRWMECPLCGKKLCFSGESEAWECESCDFVLPEEEFLDGYVFWFCDRCACFLNVQEGFTTENGRWACTECGFENGVTDDDLLGVCCECGALLEDPDASLCSDCDEAWSDSCSGGGRSS